MSFKSRLVLALVSFLLVTPFWGCSKEDPNSIVVLCGSVANPAIEKAAWAFEAETGIKVIINSGSSGEILSRLRDDKKGDLYIPGSSDYMARAKRARVIDTDSEAILAYLVPVIAVQKGNPKNITRLTDLLKSGVRVAIGDPMSVCSGLYAYEILEAEGLLDDVREARTFVAYALTCQETADMLASKKVDAVIGWDVFGAWYPDDIVIVPIRPDQMPRLGYIPGAVCSSSDKKEKARQFLDYLSSVAGQSVFSGLGYITESAQAKKYAPKAEIGKEYLIPDDYLPLVR